jgi:chemotaxis methyl-accepting protein methylase
MPAKSGCGVSFIRETGGFQIRREVREIVLFATQNLGFGEWRTGPFDIDHLFESEIPYT